MKCGGWQDRSDAKVTVKQWRQQDQVHWRHITAQNGSKRQDRILEGRKSRNRPEFEDEACWEQREVCLEPAREPEFGIIVREASRDPRMTT